MAVLRAGGRSILATEDFSRMVDFLASQAHWLCIWRPPSPAAPYAPRWLPPAILSLLLACFQDQLLEDARVVSSSPVSVPLVLELARCTPSLDAFLHTLSVAPLPVVAQLLQVAHELACLWGEPEALMAVLQSLRSSGGLEDPDVKLGASIMLAQLTSHAQSLADAQLLLPVLGAPELLLPLGSFELCQALLQNSRGFSGVGLEEILAPVISLYQAGSSRGALSEREQAQAMLHFLTRRVYALQLSEAFQALPCPLPLTGAYTPLPSLQVCHRLAAIPFLVATANAASDAIMRSRSPEEIVGVLATAAFEALQSTVWPQVEAHIRGRLVALCSEGERTRALQLAVACVEGANPRLGHDLVDAVAQAALGFLNMHGAAALDPMLNSDDALEACALLTRHLMAPGAVVPPAAANRMGQLAGLLVHLQQMMAQQQLSVSLAEAVIAREPQLTALSTSHGHAMDDKAVPQLQTQAAEAAALRGLLDVYANQFVANIRSHLDERLCDFPDQAGPGDAWAPPPRLPMGTPD